MGRLSTATISDLASRNAEKLNALGDGPDLDLGSLTTSQRRQLSAARSVRERLETISDVQPQQRDYGLAAWQSSFTKLGDIEQLDGIKHTGQDLRNFLWSRVPNSRFKRVQEAFSRTGDGKNPDNRIVPNFRIDDRGRVCFLDKPDFRSLSVRGTLISPDLIPDDLAQNLGIADFTEDRGKRDARLRRLTKKADPAVLKRFKMILDSADPLDSQPQNYRVLVIRPASEQIQSLYPDSRGPGPELIGCMLYSREDPVARRERVDSGAFAPPRKLIVQLFDSLYATHRKPTHQRSTYDQELKSLSGMVEELSYQIDRLLSWKSDTPADEKAQIKEEATAAATRFAETLQNVENCFKRQAQKFVQDALTIKDSLGRDNPSRNQMKLRAAERRIRNRLREMVKKGGFNEEDRLMLSGAKERSETAFKGFRCRIEARAALLAPDTPQGISDLFSNEPMDKEALRTRVFGAMSRLGIHGGEFSRITTRPFTTFATAMNQEVNALRRALFARNRDAAIHAVVKLHVIGKFEAACACFENMRGFVIETDSIPLSRAHEFVDRLDQIFATREIFPDVPLTEEYDAAFLLVADGIPGLRKILEPYQGRDVSAGERSNAYRGLKEYIENQEHDPESLVASLSKAA